jgi:hypothetical protein
MAGPFAELPCPDLFVSPIGTVPKKDTDDIRRIHNLSHPIGASINDFIEYQPLRYASFDDAVSIAKKLGPKALFAKLDVKAAFRCIPIHPSDRKWLGMRWRNQYYADLALPFGMSSSPALWEQFASLVEWIIRNSGVRWVCHYVDDFLLGGAADSDECARAVARACEILKELGVPVNAEKLAAEGTPATIVRFLGIIIDTVLQQARLDPERLDDIRSELKSWAARKSCTRQELQSLVGVLSFASKVVPAGRTFVRRMTLLLRKAAHPSHHIHLNTEFHKDLNWWSEFVVGGRWNGVSILLDPEWTQPPQTASSEDCPDHIYTDASGTGFGAVFGKRWLAGTWSRQDVDASIRDKILSPTFVEFRAIALATWGHLCRGRRITIQSDSNVAVQTFQGKSARHPALLDLIRTILFIAASSQFALRLRHIDGKANVFADMLSRGQVQDFQKCQSSFDRLPTPPQPLPLHTW